MFKTKTLVLAALVALATAGCSQSEPEVSKAPCTFTPGTYTATVNGHNAPMTVKVTVSKDRIENIDVSDNLETIGVGKVALQKMSDKIIQYQSLGVDAVTGATLSSFALRNGVSQCLKEAKGDMKALNKQVEQHPAGELKIQADVVVIGGGGAGLAAAISAHQAGAKKVVVLEKQGFLGGSTNVSEGALNAVDPKRQGKLGIEDSHEKFYEQTMKGGHEKGTPEMVKYLTENSMKAVEWMESLGVQFKDEIGTATGALWQRSHYPATPSGNTYIRTFEKVIADSKGAIEVITDAQVTDLIEANDRISGAIADNFGRKVIVSANQGVIIATGGFGANVKLRQEVNTGVWKHVKLDEALGCTNLKNAAQGDGLVLAQKYGAELVGLDDIQIHPCGTPGTGLMENIRTSGRNRIFVNVDGDRFVNEGAPRDVLAQGIIDQPGSTYWVVVNHVRYPSRDFVDRNGASIENMVALGSVVEADTLEALAEKTGMKAENLKASIDNYNSVVDGAKDPLGFVADNKADVKLTEGPWYACKKVPTVHHTMGGIKINEHAQVIGTDGKVIKGLYAAGEVTGGIHGSNRLGGNAIADCMVFGYTAGQQIVKDAK